MQKGSLFQSGILAYLPASKEVSFQVILQQNKIMNMEINAQFEPQTQ